MIPASHLLSGFLAGRLWAGRAGGSNGTVRSWRDPLVLVAVAGSVLPDLDVLPGLIAGFRATALHRGPTHSLAGALIEAALLAGIATVLFGRIRPVRLLFSAALAGILTHVFWDLLNPWGETLWWPFVHRGFRLPLVHEGDLVVFAVLALAAVLAGAGRARAAIVLAGLMLPAYLAYQVVARTQARSLAEWQFAGRQVHVYPSPSLACPWLALSASTEDLVAACASGPFARELKVVRRVRVLDSAWVRLTEHLPEVRRFRRRDFPFAEVQRQQDGRTLVIWKDLRESIASPAAGLYVLVGSSGRVLGLRHQWPLSLWFW